MPHLRHSEVPRVVCYARDRCCPLISEGELYVPELAVRCRPLYVLRSAGLIGQAGLLDSANGRDLSENITLKEPTQKFRAVDQCFRVRRNNCFR